MKICVLSQLYVVSNLVGSRLRPFHGQGRVNFLQNDWLLHAILSCKGGWWLLRRRYHIPVPNSGAIPPTDHGLLREEDIRDEPRRSL